MSKVSSVKFFRQKRFDGGVRMGVSVGQDLVLHHFSPGSKEDDPALEWYVDVELKAAGIPSEPEQLRQWLIDQRATVSQVLKELSEEFRAGTDFPKPPFQHRKSRDGIQVTVSYGAIRRVDCLQMAKVFQSLARSWSNYIRRLEVFSPTMP